MLPRRDRNTSVYIGLEEHPNHLRVPPRDITIYYSIQQIYNRSTYRLGCRIEQSPAFRLESLKLNKFKKLHHVFRLTKINAITASSAPMREVRLNRSWRNTIPTNIVNSTPPELDIGKAMSALT